ncbi:Peptidoglycan-binding Lysin subgroup [Aspergillus mulundensis]|uniref:chitinase n=1 Tax=Aspergillus mulundensis TaxID=1810919 RepID=A0A3D8RQN9_9EURO|nr:Peptidoglycan-binding Lysin subgroup [Aspergillus mulundensis]RDW76305.1 Peptidoglycan-binding Lysin subgroup [Aspergillus mulundensis]
MVALAQWALLLLAPFSRGVLAAQDVEGNPVLTLGDVVPIDSPGTFYSDLHPCPASCAGSKPANWTVYSSADRLALCAEPVLFDLAIYNPVDTPNARVKLRACTPGASGNANSTVNALFQQASSAPTKRAEDAAASCLPTAEERRIPVEFGTAGAIRTDRETTGAVSAALDELQRYLSHKRHCGESIVFAHVNGTVAGAYVGPSFGQATIASIVSRLTDHVKDEGSSDTMAAQVCGKGRNAHHVLGVAVDTTSNVAAVQRALRSWKSAECIDSFDATETWDNVQVHESVVDMKPIAVSSPVASPTPFASSMSSSTKSSLQRRGECSTIRVVSGDDCGMLAARCGISDSDFIKYNSDADLCSKTVKPPAGQPVCCSSGTLPDIRPMSIASGTCATHFVEIGDNCSDLAAANGLTIRDIEKFNNGTTWGWNGCNDLDAGINICLSKGDPPMPAPVSNAICGPTKPGTQQPTDGSALEDLNPCPLNVCCNIWGQCGITEDFCLEERGPADNPGTSPVGKNGCVSSCGVDIKNNDEGPSSYGRVGYYESWNFDRDCLNLRATNANTDSSYTHMHWAFAGVNTEDWTVSINDSYGQWEDFKSLNVKRIISFGGWGFSTEPETYDVLRQAMSPANRATFATNVAKFLSDEGLDGVDFDWEYPGATDIPDTPPGQASDGANYYKFLIVMRRKLADDMSLSIAAPASYWYLKAFPIKNMAEELDYIVYMTYDLHGQWDAGNQYSMEGCPTGNCLRSHVNLTETTYTLSMITKAGVPSNKIFVGESSYGRSFHMAEEGCTGPMCGFTGDRLNSDAQKGSCTDTAGYISNAEIDQILTLEDNVKSWHDGASNSDIMVWDDLEWVAYMSETTKSTRRDHWKGLNFAGTIDWAVDLQAFTDDDYLGPLGDEGVIEPMPSKTLADCDQTFSSIEEIEDNIGDIPEECISEYLLVALQKQLDDTLSRYDALMEDGYDKSFDVYAGAVVDSGEKQVRNFTMNTGNDYFTCIVTEWIRCCEMCYDDSGKDSLDCRYCGDFDCGWEGVCENPEVHCDPPNYEYLNMTQPCPPDYSLRGQSKPPKGDLYSESVYWTLRDSKADQFFADLYTNVGIDKENIAFKDVHHITCGSDNSDSCGPNWYWDYDFPVPEGYEKEDVINPEDVVSEARKNLTDLSPQMTQVIKDVHDRVYLGDAADLVDALSLPIYMVTDAVANMEEIVDIAEEIREAERKAIILAFLSAILFFVPVIGEIASAVSSLATIGRVISLLGAVGNAAFDVYTIVDDPENAPLAIFSLVLAPLALSDVVAISKAAQVRRGMSADQLATLGGTVSKNLDTVQRLKGTCRL